MKRMLWRSAVTLLGCGVVFAWAGTASAQETRRQTTVTETRQQTEVRSTTQVRRTSVVMDAQVQIEGGTTIGQVVDFVLNEHGCVEYLVVAYQDKYLAVPWTVATVNFEQKTVRLDVTREKLSQVPTFTRDRWPDLTDSRFTQRIYSAFGVQAEQRERRYGAEEGRQGRERRYGTEEERRRLDRRPGTDRPGTERLPGRDRGTIPPDRRPDRPGIDRQRPGQLPPTVPPGTQPRRPEQKPPQGNRPGQQPDKPGQGQQRPDDGR